MSRREAERHSLAAGEEATLTGDAVVEITLQDGSLEAAGAMLHPGRVVRVDLAVRTTSVYSLTGGSFTVASSGRVRVARAPTGIPRLLEAARPIKAATSAKVLVMSERGCGKSYAARTVLNSLLREAAPSDSRIVFVGADAGECALSCPGTVAAAEVQPPSLVPDAPFVDACPVVHFVGTASSSTASSPLVLNALQQVMAGAEWLVRRGEQRVQHMVVDAPTAPEKDSAWFWKQVVQVVAPTHIIAVGDGMADLSSDISRLSGAAFTVVPALVPPPAGAALDAAQTRGTASGITEHFCGPAAVPMSCSHVTAPLSQLAFVRLVAGDDGVVAQALSRDEAGALTGRLCGVSHGVVEAEAPFANIAGVAIVESVDAEADEAVLFVPSGDATLPHNMLVVGAPDLCYVGATVAANAV